MINDINKHIDELTIDEQKMKFPDETGWEILKQNPILNGRELGAQKLLWDAVALAKQEPCLKVGLGELSKHINKWGFYLILFIGKDIKIRIQLRNGVCKTCGWSGKCGTTADADLFLGSGERQAAYERALNISPCACPSCGETMDKHIVWCQVKR